MATQPNWWDEAPLISPANDPSFTGYIPGTPKAPPVPANYEPDPDKPGAVRPIKGGPADPQAGQNAGASDLTGEAYLGTLDKPTGALVKALAEGRKSFPSGAALRNPYWQNMLTHVSNYDPGFDETTYTGRSATRRDFSVGTAGKNIRALNTAIGHLGQLYEQIGGTASHGLVPLNVAENKLRANILGESGPTTYASTTSALSGELTAVYRGSGGAEADIQRYISELSPNASEEQKKATIKNIAGLLNSRLEALQDQYSKGMGVGSKDFQFLDSHAQDVLNKIGGTPPPPPSSGGGGGNGPLPNGGRDPTPEEQREFFRILNDGGVDAANDYLRKTTGRQIKDPEAVKKGGFAKALEYAGDSPFMQSFNNIAGGIIEGAAALPDLAAKTVGGVLSLPAEWAGYPEVAQSLRNPIQLGDLAREKIPQPEGALSGFNRFAGQIVGGAAAIPQSAANALTELVVGRGSRAAGQAPSALSAYAPQPQEVAAAAQRQGVSLLPADVGGEFLKGMTAGASQVPITRGPIVKLARQGAEDLKGAANRAASMAGTVLPEDEAGELGRLGAQGWIKSITDRGTRWYDKAYELSDNLKLMPPKALEYVDAKIAEYAQAGDLGKPMIAALEKIKSTLNQSGGITVSGMRLARTLLRPLAQSEDLRGTPAKKVFGDVLDLAREDLTDALVANGKERAANMFARADNLWAQRIDRIDEILEPVVGKAQSGEDIIRNFEKMARGGKGGVRRLQGILDTLPKDEKGSVIATIIDKAGRARPSAQDAAGGVFSPETFLTNWNTWTPKAKRALFGNGELRENLNDIALLASAKRRTNAIASKSNSAIAITGNAAITSGIAYLEPVSAAVGTVLQYTTGRLLASPAFTRWLARMPKTPAGINRHIGRLDYIARSSPAVANDITALQRALSEPVTAPLAAEPQGNQNE